MYTGTKQSFKVPAGVTQVTIAASGAGGAPGYGFRYSKYGSGWPGGSRKGHDTGDSRGAFGDLRWPGAAAMAALTVAERARHPIAAALGAGLLTSARG
ncbi:MAG: hypothetical protein WA428_02480 [Candidatus Cybelea sp.]